VGCACAPPSPQLCKKAISSEITRIPPPTILLIAATPLVGGLFGLLLLFQAAYSR
jgi:hypothetical protein